MGFLRGACFLLLSVSLTGFGDAPQTRNADEVKAAFIKEAEADLEYYKARVDSAVYQAERIDSGIKFLELKLERIRKLADKGASTQETVELAESKVDEAKIEKKVLASRVEEARAELHSAEARLLRVKAMEFDGSTGHVMPIPKVRGN